jgi:hypothetical protein
MEQTTFEVFTQVNIQSKYCTKCGQLKPFDGFCKNKNSKDGLSHQCRECASNYERLHKERRAAQKREYRKENREEILRKSKEYYENNREVICKKTNEYKRKNREAIKEKTREYTLKTVDRRHEKYMNNREEVLAKCKEYCIRNSEAIKIRRRIQYLANREKKAIQDKLYRASPNGRIRDKKKKAKRRLLGFHPINEYFPGSHYHHLRYDANGNKDNDIGIYLPAELHNSVCHNGYTGKNMDLINKLAIAWYLENCPITPDTFHLLGFDNWNDFYLRYKDVDVSSYTN